jgi:hypothetical protein
LVVARDGAFSHTPGSAIVTEDGHGHVLIIRGYVEPSARVVVDCIPGARAVEAGQSISGTAELPLPLAAWHPNTGARPLDAPATTATFEVGYVGGDPEWTHPPLDDGSTLEVPKIAYVLAHQRLVRGATLKLP